MLGELEKMLLTYYKSQPRDSLTLTELMEFVFLIFKELKQC